MQAKEHYRAVPEEMSPVSDNDTDRRLTTILAADVVGYSRLMAADEAGSSPNSRLIVRN